jgi:RepB DNA-primase from phage plasmid/CHC2 zinc finger
MMPNDPTAAFLRVLAGDQPEDRYLEIRSRTPKGLRQEFFATNRLDALHQRALWRGQRTDTYIGVVPRTSRSGKKQAVGHSRLIWCEIDAPDAAKRLATAPVAPVLTVESGSPGHMHAYWLVNQPLEVELLERANSALVTQLGGDPACTDASRILRIPGTLNFKHQPPRPVRLASYNIRAEPLALEQIVGELTPPRAPTPVPAKPRSVGPMSAEARSGLDRTRALKLISAREWARILLGVEPEADGKIACPFHAGGKERTPSLQLYTDGTWFCYGCREGGSAIDFAAHLWHLPPRGNSFNEIRDRLWVELGQRGPALDRDAAVSDPDLALL